MPDPHPARSEALPERLPGPSSGFSCHPGSRLSAVPRKASERPAPAGHICSVCGHVRQGSALPEDAVCPVCGTKADGFRLLFPPPAPAKPVPSTFSGRRSR